MDDDAPLRRPTYDELLADNRRLREENARLRERIAQLERQVEELLRLVEKLRGEGKRQAAPFRKQEQPAAEAKKPGRRSGKRHGPHAHRSEPPRIDDIYRVPLPAQCPHCGAGNVQKTEVVPQYQTEIPRQVIYRRFDVQHGRCRNCGHAVAGRHPLMTGIAGGAAASQFGPHVHSLLAMMNKECGLSHGKCAKLLATAFEGLTISRATSARSMLRTARRCEPAYAEARRDVRAVRQVVPDETGWRVGGRSAWLHGFVGPRATCYVIDPTRSGQPAERLLGAIGPAHWFTTAGAFTTASRRRRTSNAWPIWPGAAAACSPRPVARRPVCRAKCSRSSTGPTPCGGCGVDIASMAIVWPMPGWRSAASWTIWRRASSVRRRIGVWRPICVPMRSGGSGS